MLDFRTGALRPVTDETRAETMSAANDLVRRTLAQHGLMPEAGTSPHGRAQSPMPLNIDLDGMLARFRTPTVEQPVLPDGAEFRLDQFACAAGSRKVRTYVPASASEGVSGIIVMLHGCTQTAEDFAAGTGMNALAEEHRFVVLYPEQSRGDNAQSCWNWFSRGDQRRDRGEPAIIAGLTRRAMTEFDVPSERTFVAGLSAGAAMAVIMGETYPDLFAGVGAHSGLPYGSARDVPSAFAAMAGNAQDIARPKSDGVQPRTIVFHGSSDTTVEPSNGVRIVRDFSARGSGTSVEIDDAGTIAGRSYRRTTICGDDGSAELEHWVVDGLGHAWSGGQPGGSYTDARGPDASAEMVRFFFAGGK